MIKNKFKIIFFDFDGVIIDSFEIAFQCMKELLPDLTTPEFRDYFNGNFGEEVQKKRPNGDYKSFMLTFAKRYSELLKKELLFENMDSIIEKLSKKYYLVIISSNISSAIIKFLEDIKIAGLFSDVLGADFHGSKVEKFKFVIDKYKIKKPNCLMVTDTVGDIREANNLGISCIAVAWGYHDTKTLQSGNPKHVISDRKDLISRIDLALTDN